MSRVGIYLKRLKRREKFLEDRVKGTELDKSHYDRAELMALKWILKYTEDTPNEAENHQSKWFKDQEDKI
jgi:hypothetical protein